MSTNKRVWFITGSSTGFGRALAEALLDKDELVFATARKPEQLDDLSAKFPDRLKAARLDVTRSEEIQAAVELALKRFGRIDVLVNNAGYGALGALEEVAEEAIRRQFETNVFGALATMRTVLPHMRQQRSGHILNLSSVGGLVTFPGASIYSATKFALEGLSEALAKEAEHLGIKVTIVEPGAFRTDFNGRSLSTPEHRIEDYQASSGQFLDWAETVDGQQPGDPVKAVQAMIQAVESDNPPLRLVLGADAWEAIHSKMETVRAEMDAWKSVTMDTAFEGIEVGAIGS